MRRTGVAKDHPGVRLRIVGVDPGIRSIFVAYGLDGTKVSLTLGEYASLARTSAFAHVVSSAALKAALPDLPCVRRPGVATTLAYANALLTTLDRFQAVYGSERVLRARLSVCGHVPGRPPGDRVRRR